MPTCPYARCFLAAGVEDAPLLALDLMLPPLSSAAILTLTLALVPRILGGMFYFIRVDSFGAGHSSVDDVQLGGT